MVAQYQHWRGKSKEWHDTTRARLADIYRQLGWTEFQALDAYDARKALRLLGYESDDAFIQEAIADGLLEAPATIVCEAWHFNGVLELAVVLESQRRFVPFHRWHRSKQTEAELTRDMLAAGLVAGDLLALYATPAETLLQFDFSALELPVARIVQEIIAEKLDA